MADDLGALAELLEIVRALRAPGGCEWDRSQTIQSLRPFLLEEAYEAADAAEAGDYEALCGELGDLLLHVFMAAVIGEENGWLDLASIASGISAKLRRRHPHVFGDRELLAPADVERQWESIKAAEKKTEGFFDSIPESMPALQAAWRIQQRASEVGFDWPGAEETLESLRLRLDGLARMQAEDPAVAGEIGHLLFDFVNYSRVLRLEPELALRRASRGYRSRFSRMESILKGRGTPLGMASAAHISAAWRDAAGEVAGSDRSHRNATSAGKEST
jgi:tetrapyrrole methylase family protein/MazG family protein